MSVRPLFELAGDVQRSKVRGRATTSCVRCGLYEGVTTPRMLPYGRFGRGLMVIGEAPGATEDKQGRPWVGETGQLLRGTLADLDVDLDADAISLNSVNCRPSGNRDPTPHEQSCCATVLVTPTIERHRPRVILLLGGAATAAVAGRFSPDLQGSGINKWRGWRIPVPAIGAWLCPTFHPSFVSREDRREVATIWESDLRAAVALLDTPVPEPVDHRRLVTILRGDDEVVAALELVRRRRRPVSFDYETTGLRASLHKLICASFCQSSGRAYAFMWRDSPAVQAAWAALLADPEVGKISHNLKFEAEWSYTHCGVDDIVWVWDSMLAAHVVDNRPGLCGLKLQVFLNFGVPPYDAVIEPFLRSRDPRDPAATNTIDEFLARHGEDELLIYCGLDSLFAHMLMVRQKGLFGG